MTRPVILLFMMLMASHTLLPAQEDTPKDEIVDAIKTGDFNQLSGYFDAALELTVPQNNGNFSKKQATVIMRHFFSHHPPEDFSIQHEGRTGDGSLHLIGTYKSTHGESYRTLILLKKLNGRYMIKQLQFE